MNDAVLTELKILVERVVRPLQASSERKAKIRPELLAHITSVFEEELASGVDEPTALRNSAARFGEPHELTRELQNAVPRFDRALRLLEWFAGFPPRSSVVSRALQCAGITFLAFTCAFVPVMILRDRLNEWPLLFGAPLLPFGFELLVGLMRQALDPARRSWRLVVALGLASGPLVPVVTIGVSAAISRQPWESLWNVAPLVPFAMVLTPLVVLIMAHFTGVGIREHEEWAKLRID